MTMFYFIFSSFPLLLFLLLLVGDYFSFFFFLLLLLSFLSILLRAYAKEREKRVYSAYIYFLYHSFLFIEKKEYVFFRLLYIVCCFVFCILFVAVGAFSIEGKCFLLVFIWICDVCWTTYFFMFIFF